MSLETLLRDVHFGLRILRRSPGFSLTAVLTLALGIGANTAIFTAANDFLLRPLPFANSDRVVMVKLYDQKQLQSGWTDPANFKFWREHNSVFEHIAAWSDSPSEYNLTGPEGPERVTAKQVTRAFFRVLGVQPVLGRTFLDGEDRPNGPHLAVISHSLWKTRYGGTPAVLGRMVALNGKDFTIIGVLPANFHFSTKTEDVWTLLPDSGEANHGGYFLETVALLKSGITIAQARADMSIVWEQFAREYPEWSQGMKVAVEPMRDRYTNELRPALLTLFCASALVLLIACVNLANLLLARAASRQKEMAVRQALGGARTRIVQQLLTENALIALMGGIGGLFLAFAGVRFLYAMLPNGWQPLTRDGIDTTVLAFCLMSSIFTVTLFGVAPALGMTNLDVNESLKDTRRTPLTGVTRQSLRAALVAGEIALAVMLLTGAGLLIKSFMQLSAVSLGFHPESTLTVTIFRTKNDAPIFLDNVLGRISALPGVRAAGAVNIPPLSGGGWSQDIVIEGHPPRPKGDFIWAAHREVSLGYFRAMGIPLRAGRSFVSTDFDKRTVLVSETMAHRYWPGENPLGKRFGVNCEPPKCAWNSVAGVVGDVKELGANGAPAAAMYFLGWMNNMTLVVRGTQLPTKFATDVRSIVHSVDPDQPVSEVRTMESIVSESVAPQRLTMWIADLFATLALILASIGIYGVTSFSVGQRRHEFGIRMTLGAEPSDIFRLVEGQGLKLVGVGIAGGVLTGLALMRLASSLLFGVKPRDPLTFVLAATILGIVALIAIHLPARRASRLDPIVELRHE